MDMDFEIISEACPFTHYPDWLVLKGFPKMNKEQKENFKDRYEQLLKEKHIFEENAFSRMLEYGEVTNYTEDECKNPLCVGGKLLRGDDFLGFCECMNKESIDKLKEQSLMPKKLLEKKLGQYKIEGNSENEKARLKLKGSLFKIKDEEKPKGYLFLGKANRGKTHLASAVANEYLNNGVAVRFFDYEKDINDIKANIKDNIYQEKIFKSCTCIPLLFIDNLFGTRPTDNDIKYIYRIINERHNKDLPVIITCRLSFDEFCNDYPSLFGKVYELVPRENIIEFQLDRQLKF